MRGIKRTAKRLMTKPNLLHEALFALREYFPTAIDHNYLRDDTGKFAMVVLVNHKKMYLMCAKRSMNGGQVSFDKEIIVEAEKLQTKVILFLKQDEARNPALYVFIPEDIRTDKDTWMNTRNDKTMYNCTIRLGVNIKNYFLRQLSPKEAELSKAIMKHFPGTVRTQ